MTLAPLRENKAGTSLAKASTPEPFSASRVSNWVARVGGLPAYIQHIAHDLMEKRGKSESNAIQMAIGIVKNWATGLGKVNEDTRAAARKAWAEWVAKKAASHGKAAVQHSDFEPLAPTLADELAVREAAILRLAIFERQVGPEGILELLDPATLMEAAAGFAPSLRRVASAPGESERHEVVDGDQTVGTVARQTPGYNGEVRYRAMAVNGERVGDLGLKSRQAALDALRKHLEEAPARVMAHRDGKFLVARPKSYGGTMSYDEFPNEQSARHAAGLPPSASSPERASQVEQLGEMISFDLATAAGVPPVDRLRRAAEARLGVPLAEAFHPGELRDFRGRWKLGGAHHVGGYIPLSGTDVRSVGASRPARAAAALVPEHRVPGGRSVAKASVRYEGGVVRSTRKARDKLASMPQIELRDLPKSIGRGIYTPSAEKAAKDIMAGRVHDTEHAHSTMVNGKRVYSRDRKALHQQIVNNLLQGKGEHVGSARAIFTAGGPASGKSGLIKGGSARFERDMHAESPVNLPKDVVHVNPDVIREMLPEYKAMVKAGRTDAAAKTHEEASALAATVMKLATGRQHHVLVDTVGNSESGKFARKIQRAVDAKMHTEVHYATVPVLTAFERAKKRGEETGRFVEESYLRKAHKNVSLRFPEVIRIKGAHVTLYDTSNGSRMMAEKPAGTDKLSIKDRVGVTGFLNKGQVRGDG